MFAKFITSALFFLALTHGAVAIACGSPGVRLVAISNIDLIEIRPKAACMPDLPSVSSMRIQRILLLHTRQPVSPRRLFLPSNRSERLEKSMKGSGGGGNSRRIRYITYDVQQVHTMFLNWTLRLAHVGDRGLQVFWLCGLES